MLETVHIKNEGKGEQIMRWLYWLVWGLYSTMGIVFYLLVFDVGGYFLRHDVITTAGWYVSACGTLVIYAGIGYLTNLFLKNLSSRNH